MSTQVWKYPLQARTIQEIEMPWGAKVLKLAVFEGTPCLWAMIDSSRPANSLRDFRLYETGEDMGDASQLEYIGTIAMEDENGQPRVLHCFEALKIIV